MADRFDIQLSNNVFFIDPKNGGDFVLGNSNEQHIADNLNAFPGWWKENFTMGVGVLQYSKSKGTEQALEQSVKINLTADLYVANPNVSLTPDGILTVNPNVVYEHI